jgi:hypothetical protein
MYEYGLVEALRQAIKAESEISEHLNGIYSHVPAEVKPPYIRIQACQDRALSPTIIYGDVILTIVSRYRGQLEINKILKTVRQILQKPLLTAQGHQLIFKEDALAHTLASDNLTQSMTLTFRVKLKINQ